MTHTAKLLNYIAEHGEITDFDCVTKNRVFNMRSRWSELNLPESWKDWKRVTTAEGVKTKVRVYRVKRWYSRLSKHLTEANKKRVGLI